MGWEECKEKLPNLTHFIFKLRWFFSEGVSNGKNTCQINRSNVESKIIFWLNRQVDMYWAVYQIPDNHCQDTMMDMFSPLFGSFWKNMDILTKGKIILNSIILLLALSRFCFFSYEVFTDSFYTRKDLLDALFQRQVYLCGTMKVRIS